MSIKFKGIKKLSSDNSISSNTSTVSNDGTTKKSKGIRGLLNRARSIPSPVASVTSSNSSSVLSSSYAEGPSVSAASSPLHNQIPTSPSNPPGSSLSSTQLSSSFTMYGSQEELQRVLPSQQQPLFSTPVMSSPSPSASLHHQGSLSTGGSPSPQMRLQPIASNSASSTPLPPSSSVFSVSNMCSPINDVIIEEEYEDPADMANGGQSPVGASTETEIDESVITRNGIYSEPCDTKVKTSANEEGEKSPAGDEEPADEASPVDQFQSLAPLSTDQSTKVNNNDCLANNQQPQPALQNQPGGGESSAAQSFLVGSQAFDHHPASPFEPLSKTTSPSSLIKPSKEPLNCNDDSSNQIPRRTKNSVPMHSSSNLVVTSKNDSPHPTYEEAWDLKMNRLGVNMSRLNPTATPIQQQDTPLLAAPTLPPPPPPPFEQTGGRTSRLQHNFSSPVGERAISPHVSQHSKNKSSNNKKNTHYHQSTPAAPAYYSQSVDTAGGGGGGGGEYDYAYNKNWKMNVQKNLSVSLSIPNDTSSGGLGGGVAPVPILGTTPLPEDFSGRNSSSETSPNSPGNYEEPWDKKQGSRIISQLSSGPRTNASISEQYLFASSVVDNPNRNWSRPAYSKDCIYANDSIDVNLPLEDQPWFHGTLTRIKAEDMLSHPRFCEGSYLVRRSETSHEDFSLTIKRHGAFLHMKISRNPRGQYILGQYSQPYTSVPVMIHHYSHSILPIKGADSMTLQHPVYRQSTVS